MQDDASHFLQELVNLSESNKVIKQYRHVHFRQEVHLRNAFPTHLIYPEEGGEEFENLISTWANTAEGQVLAGSGLWVAQQTGVDEASSTLTGSVHLSAPGVSRWGDHQNGTILTGRTPVSYRKCPLQRSFLRRLHLQRTVLACR